MPPPPPPPPADDDDDDDVIPTFPPTGRMVAADVTPSAPRRWTKPRREGQLASKREQIASLCARDEGGFSLSLSREREREVQLAKRNISYKI